MLPNGSGGPCWTYVSFKSEESETSPNGGVVRIGSSRNIASEGSLRVGDLIGGCGDCRPSCENNSQESMVSIPLEELVPELHLSGDNCL